MTFLPRLSLTFYKYYTSRSAKRRKIPPESMGGIKVIILFPQICAIEAIKNVRIGDILALVNSVFNFGKFHSAKS